MGDLLGQRVAVPAEEWGHSGGDFWGIVVQVGLDVNGGECAGVQLDRGPLFYWPAALVQQWATPRLIVSDPKCPKLAVTNGRTASQPAAPSRQQYLEPHPAAPANHTTHQLQASENAGPRRQPHTAPTPMESQQAWFMGTGAGLPRQPLGLSRSSSISGGRVSNAGEAPQAPTTSSAPPHQRAASSSSLASAATAVTSERHSASGSVAAVLAAVPGAHDWGSDMHNLAAKALGRTAAAAATSSGRVPGIEKDGYGRSKVPLQSGGGGRGVGPRALHAELPGGAGSTGRGAVGGASTNALAPRTTTNAAHAQHPSSNSLRQGRDCGGGSWAADASMPAGDSISHTVAKGQGVACPVRAAVSGGAESAHAAAGLLALGVDLAGGTATDANARSLHLLTLPLKRGLPPQPGEGDRQLGSLHVIPQQQAKQPNDGLVSAGWQPQQQQLIGAEEVAGDTGAGAVAGVTGAGEAAGGRQVAGLQPGLPIWTGAAALAAGIPLGRYFQWS